jgi:hypothetical protein
MGNIDGVAIIIPRLLAEEEFCDKIFLPIFVNYLTLNDVGTLCHVPGRTKRNQLFTWEHINIMYYSSRIRGQNVPQI